MKIAILVGNGFDLNMGLPTRYSDFLQHYRRVASSDPSIRRFKNKLFRFIGPRIENWADLEETLGKLTIEFPENITGLNDFFKFHADILDHLKLYLEGQANRINYSSASSSICNAFFSLPNSLLSNLNPTSRGIINDALAIEPPNRITYTFASFNYTNVLDMCVQTYLGDRRSALQSWTIEPAVFHIHGYTNLHPILGVDNLTQVHNHFENPHELERGFIKKTTLALCNINVNQFTQNLDESQIILLYGLSLGVTDVAWWEYLCKWLVADKTHQLIIYTRCEGNADIIPRVYITSVEAILNTMMRYLPAELSEVQTRNVSSQIHVVVNRNLFPFRLV